MIFGGARYLTHFGLGWWIRSFRLTGAGLPAPENRVIETARRSFRSSLPARKGFELLEIATILLSIARYRYLVLARGFPQTRNTNNEAFDWPVGINFYSIYSSAAPWSSQFENLAGAGKSCRMRA